jgi:hypothetical protein
LPPAQTFTVTFNVKYNSVGVEGAIISLTGNGNATTNVSGVSVFSNVNAVATPGIAYTVTKSGYEIYNGNVIVDGNETVNVTLTPSVVYYDVTFSVKDTTENIIEGSIITLTGYGNQTTDVLGLAIFSGINPAADPGIEYSILKTGFIEFTGNVIVDENETVNVELIPLPNGIESIPNNFNIYPNPTNGKFVINNTINTNFSYQIVNQLGQILLFSNNVNDNILEIDLSDYAKGLYFVKIYADNMIITKTISVL